MATSIIHIARPFLVLASLIFITTCGKHEPAPKQEPPTIAPPAQPKAVAPTVPMLTREHVIEARRKFKVQVVSFDATQEIGELPYSDFVRLRITNRSDVVLSNLTVLTKRLDSRGRMIGSSRAPSIDVADLKPAQSAEVDYYPKGHLPGVKKITVEIEALVSRDNEQFFSELPKQTTQH
jgi:hypothetical protein